MIYVLSFVFGLTFTLLLTLYGPPDPGDDLFFLYIVDWLNLMIGVFGMIRCRYCIKNSNIERP